MNLMVLLDRFRSGHGVHHGLRRRRACEIGNAPRLRTGPPSILPTHQVLTSLQAYHVEKLRVGLNKVKQTMELHVAPETIFHPVPVEALKVSELASSQAASTTSGLFSLKLRVQEIGQSPLYNSCMQCKKRWGEV